MTALAFTNPATQAGPTARATQPALFVVSDAPRPTQSAPARPDPVAQYRLTRRGRLTVFASTLVAFAVLLTALGAQAVATLSDPVGIETTTVAVMPGMTLWEIAAASNPSGDVRATIDEIIKLNALPVGASLQIGSQLEVPVSR